MTTRNHGSANHKRACRRRALALGTVASLSVGVMAAGCGVLDDPSGGTDAAGQTDPVTIEVVRGNLVETTTTSGRLEYTGTRDLASLVAGTVTWLAPEGRTVGNGEPLYRVDDSPVFLLTGRVPAWRDLRPDVSDGVDVLQLERALQALGHTDDLDMAVDGDWTWVTTIAVKRLQEDLGLDETGTVALGTVVFNRSPVRVAAHSVDAGAQVQTGITVLQVSATTRSVKLSLEPTQKHLVPRKAQVDLEFPDGATSRGRVTSVEQVAGDETTDESLEVIVRLTPRPGQRPAVRSQLDGASVQVGLSHTVAENVLIVPVQALVALADGGYGVEVVGADGMTSYVRVTTGAFADTDVEVRSPKLSEGTRVVVAP